MRYTKIVVLKSRTKIVVLDDHYISNLRGSCWYMLNGLCLYDPDIPRRPVVLGVN